MSWLLAIIYLFVGTILTSNRLYDVACEVEPGNLSSAVAVTFKWIVTWPAWVGRRA